ncbi:hypothetical protein [Paenibacillus glacialis]|uniref:Uncharacterized protein n=1 Tax=Paenibacillus glacialis TaxID=494026 RepID=A0A168M8N0_9BACL|nr:hypothetical protein [Paenibacillus glacialis]OAB44371.1 hypothetical protein PGLA_06860 [Paenibacillus glacialis]
MFLKRKNATQLYDRREEKKSPLVRDRRSLQLAIILLSMVIILCLRYPGPLNVVEWLFQSIGLPLYSGENGMGLHFANIFVLMLLVAVFFVLNRALERGMFIAFIVIMMLVSNAPGWITTSYQRLFASGVYAVEVDQSKVNCNYELKDGSLGGTCQLALTNYSGDVVEIVPVIEFPKFRGEEELRFPVIRLSSMTIPQRVDSVYNVSFDIEMDNNGYVSSGMGSGMIITLSDGVHERRWE